MSATRKQTIEQLSDAISQLKRSLQSYSFEHFDRLGLHPSQFALLRVIQYHQPVSHKTLTQIMQLTPGAISQLLEALERETYITRSSDPNDRRVSYISLSEQGKAMLCDHTAKRTEVLCKALARISDADIQATLRVQQALVEWFDAHKRTHD